MKKLLPLLLILTVVACAATLAQAPPTHTVAFGPSTYTLSPGCPDFVNRTGQATPIVAGSNCALIAFISPEPTPAVVVVGLVQKGHPSLVVCVAVDSGTEKPLVFVDAGLLDTGTPSFLLTPTTSLPDLPSFFTRMEAVASRKDL